MTFRGHIPVFMHLFKPFKGVMKFGGTYFLKICKNFES